MKIGIVGWYGHSNPGDDRILYCLRRLLRNHQVIPVDGFAGLRAAHEQLSKCDLVLFGGGGLIQRGTGRHADLFHSLECPLACVGISVEAVHRDNRALLDVLNDKSRFILVRDAQSAIAFKDKSKVCVGPDLTFLYPWDVSENTSLEPCGVNLRSWRYWTFEHMGRLDRMMLRIDRRCRWFGRLYPLPKWRPAEVIRSLRRHFTSLMPLPFYSEVGNTTDAQVLRKYFDCVSTEFIPEEMAACGVIVAMRLHAAIFACQMGLPFVSLAYQPKNMAFCESIDVMPFCVPISRPSLVSHAIESIKVSHRQVRNHLIAMRDRERSAVYKLLRTLLGAAIVSS